MLTLTLVKQVFSPTLTRKQKFHFHIALSLILKEMAWEKKGTASQNESHGYENESTVLKMKCKSLKMKATSLSL